jgi:hypothetical protein
VATSEGNHMAVERVQVCKKSRISLR